MDALKSYATALTDAFLCGEADLSSLITRGQRCLGYLPEWLEKLCREIIQKNLLRDKQALANHIHNFEPLRNAWYYHDIPRTAAYYYLPQPKPNPPAPFVDPSIARLNTLNDLCEFLEIDESRLLWLSDPWGSSRHYSQGPLQHYRYRWIPKANSNSHRLLEIPKPQLKNIQRKIYRELLNKIPVHSDSHGFTKGRSTVSYTNAHLDKRWVLRMDLQQFFPSVSYPRVFNIFASLGYPENITRQLSLLCTNCVPQRAIRNKINDWWIRKVLTSPHLPQGAPTSPALANLAAFKLDCRLSALAKSIDSHYSRYADDILFSGTNYRILNNLIPYIGHIIAEEGFHLNFRKTRVMGRGQRQQATGIILNKHHNLSRKEFDCLKAILHNCITKGVSSQSDGQENFKSHLEGKLNYLSMLNSSKGENLKKQFLRIDWNS